ARINFAQALAAGRASDLKLTPTKVIDRTATDAGDVVDQILAALGTAAHVPAGARPALVHRFGGAPHLFDPPRIQQKGGGAVILALSMPEFQVHGAAEDEPWRSPDASS